MRAKSRGTVDRTVSQLRMDGEWIRLVPGSFYADGEGGFACTAFDTIQGVRAELTGSLRAIEDVQRVGTAMEVRSDRFGDPRRVDRSAA